MESVSAVIPVYNGAKTVADAIQSVLRQTCKISEVIVVDDGSLDNTAEVAAEFPQTRVIRRNNGGPGAARNTGIEAATGTWIALLDHDDTWDPWKTEIQLAYSAPDVGVIHGNLFSPITFGSLWHRQAYVTPSGSLVRRKALVDVGGFEESRQIMGAEDLNLYVRIALAGWAFAQSPSGLHRWQPHDESLSSNDTKLARAELAHIDLVGSQVGCSLAEIERLKRACMLEYVRNLIGKMRWCEARTLLAECSPGLASKWLSLATRLRVRRLSHSTIFALLTAVERNSGKTCNGECNLGSECRRLCEELSQLPHRRAF